MSSNSNLPFSSINPIKCIGLNQSNPFCSIISQGKLIYSSGTNIIMENTKTNQQKILYNNTHCGQIELIHHHVTLYNEHLLALTIKDSITLMHIIVIIPLNPIIFNQEVKKDKQFTHFLKNVQEFEQINQIEFFEEGNLFAVVSTYQNLSNLSLMRSNTGQVTYQQSFIDTQLSIRCVCLNKINCISILQLNKGQIRLCLMVLDELSRKFYFNILLQRQEDVIEYYFEGYQEDNIMLVLTNLGFILIYKINEYEIMLINRIDVKQTKKTLTTEPKTHKRQNSLTSQEDFCKPISIQPANNKIIIAYEESCILGILFYSHYNPKNTKFSLIEQALSNFNFVKSIKSIKISKDNCSLAALIEIFPEKVEYKALIKENQQSPLNTEHITAFQLQNNMRESTTQAQILVNLPPAEQSELESDSYQQKQYIALQIDILSNMIDHEEQAYSTQQTFSLLSGHNLVIKAEYCIYNNTMFLLMKNKMLKYYDLTPKQHPNQYKNSIPMYKQFKIQGLLLWQKLLNAQPRSMTVHPFNYTVLLVYEEILKFHYFNAKNLFPAFIITSIKNCNIAKYSPLGDKIVLATNGAVIILNSYTFQVIKTISLPNILSQTQLKRVSNIRQRLPVIANPKLITDLAFLKNGDMLVFSGNNSFSFIMNNQKSSHFGFLELNNREKYSQILYDSVNNLVILLQQFDILILAKSNINTKNRCEVISKIEISASSAYLIQQLGILFLGGKDGVLHILKWPDYCQEELYMRTTNKYFQFRQPIINISVSANYSYIYTVSKTGSMCISQLEVNQNDENLPRQVMTFLLTSSQKPLRQGNRWLISRSDEQRKERQIIKLRGQEADIANRHTQVLKKQENCQDQLIKSKKIEFEAQYIRELKQYQEKIGFQRNMQSITLLRDQNKIFEKKVKREIQELNSEREEKMKAIFQQRTQLQKQFNAKLQQNKIKLKKFMDQNEQKLSQLKINLQNTQNKLEIEQKEFKLKENGSQFMAKCALSNLQEDHIQDINILNIEHNSEVQDLLDVNQVILSKNRNKNIEIHDFQDKLGDLNIEKQKLQFDMYKIIDESQNYQKLKQKMASELDCQKRVYDKLIKISKQLEDKVIFERKEQKKYEHKINTLEQEVSQLRDRDRTLQQKRAKVYEDFLQQKSMNAARGEAIAQLNKKWQELKDLKKEKYYQNCMLKNQYTQIIKTFMRILDIDEEKAVQQICEEYKSSTFQKKKESVRNSKFEILKAQHQKMAMDATKWKEVKQSYMNSFYRNHKKLDQENLKLTYRYNDLLRLSQQYKVQISNLQENIQKLQRSNSDWKIPKTSENKLAESRLKSHFSLLNLNKKENKQNKTSLKKKLICVSLHQQSGKFITQA